MNKIVTHIPMMSLWRDNRDIAAKRERYLTADNLRDILSIHPIEFVVADVGNVLVWMSYDQCFDFWKNEIKAHLADELTHIYLDNFPENYAYVASMWIDGTEPPIVLLEKYH